MKKWDECKENDVKFMSDTVPLEKKGWYDLEM